MADNEEFEASLGDQNTFAGGRPPADAKSLGDQMTLGGGANQEDIEDEDDIEIVDLAARYKIEKIIGKGGMGEVLQATDTRLNRKVAIKRILGSAARSKAAVSRFLTEAQSIAALNHPNVVQIYDYGRAKDGPFLIMEYVDGKSLLDRCHEGVIPLEQAVDLACQLCDGLGRAHDLGIIHRDIKPANVLLTQHGTPKLTDFGLAKAESADTGMTMAGAVLGTLDFMPPEQRRDATLADARSDLWSLAATIYQMVSGKSPKIIKFKDVPQELQNVLGKALEDEKEDRYQNASELKQALRVSLQKQESQLTSSAVVNLDTGECPACHVTNKSDRKFCRNEDCGEPLRCKCLKCQHEIPVWDKVCPECGSKQVELATLIINEFSKERERAEQLRSEYRYGYALELAEKIAGVTDRRIARHADWAKDFMQSTKAEWEREITSGQEHFAEAKKHRDAFDYESAIRTVEAIPVPIRLEEMSSFLESLKSDQQESSELLKTIKERIARRELDDLLQITERAISLRGDREDLKVLKSQLQDREKKLVAEKDDAFARADGLFEEGKAKEALKLVLPFRKSKLTYNRHKLLERLDRATAAEAELVAMVKDANADGVVDLDEMGVLLPKVTEYLKLNPNHAAMNKLHDDLMARLLNVPSEPKSSSLLKTIQERNSLSELNGLLQITGEDWKVLQKQLQDREKTSVSEGNRQVSHDEDLVNSIGLRLRLLQFGSFTMGEGREAHRVRLTKSFYMGVFQVTQGQYELVMGSNPSYFRSKENPVENVSWRDAYEFCNRLSELPKEKSAGRIYRLPTEAEWEYACRAGTQTSFCFGDDDSALGDYSWFDGNSHGTTHPVGEKKPNNWGLYDMHGNVWEWCSDFSGKYEEGGATDPKGPSSGTTHIRRGGSWQFEPSFCRSASRVRLNESICQGNLGFRVAMNFSGILK